MGIFLKSLEKKICVFLEKASASATSVEFWKEHWCDVLTALFLFGLLIYRLCMMHYPLVDNTEIGRDYWTARHIAVFGEWPLAGPWNEVFQGFINSPLYYYILGGLVFLKDNLLFLSFSNILLQVATGALLYLIGRRYFSQVTALTGVLLYLSSWEVRLQSDTIWQPQLMQPLFYASLYSLMLFWDSKKLSRLLTSCVLFVVAGSLHNSVFALLPLYCALVGWLLWKRKSSWMVYGKVVLTLAGSGVLLYGPVVWYLLKNKIAIVGAFASPDKYGFSPRAIIAHAGNNFFVLWNNFFLSFNTHSFSMTFAATAIVIALVGLYCFMRPWSSRLRLTVLGLMFIVQPILFSALFDASISRYHFVVIYGIFMLCIAEVIIGVLWRHLVGKFLALACIVFLIYIFSGQFYFFREQPSFRPANEVADGAVQTIASRVLEIQKSESFTELDFFDLKLYNPIVLNPYEELFWAPLEKRFRQEFTKHSNGAIPFITKNANQYVFIICQGVDGAFCTEKFSVDYPGYTIVEQIFDRDPIIIYVSRRI